MQSFKYFTYTPMYFGMNSVEKNSKVFSDFGKRAYIVTTRFPEGYRNIALDEVETCLTQHGISYEVNQDAMENPPVESIYDAAVRAKQFGADMIIGIGGGSALDSAKGIGVIVNRLDEDPYKIFYGHGRYDTFTNMSGMPTIAVPTSAGPGSDMAPNLILTNSKTHIKLCVDQTVYCAASILDPRYIMPAPDFIFYSGILDALAHGFESSLNRKSRFGNEMAANIGFKLFSQFKDRLYTLDRSLLSEEDYGLIMIHSSVMGAAVGQNGSSLPHGMGYPLSQYKGVNHGYASAMFLAEYLRVFRDKRRINEMLAMCGFSDIDQLDDFVRRIVAANVDFSITDSEIIELAKDFSENPGRMTRHPEEIGYDEVYGIFKNSLRPFTV